MPNASRWRTRGGDAPGYRDASALGRLAGGNPQSHRDPTVALSMAPTRQRIKGYS
jgi:hypothetical protein